MASINIPTKEQIITTLPVDRSSIVKMLFETIRFKIFLSEHFQETMIFGFSEIKIGMIWRMCKTINYRFHWKTMETKYEIFINLIELMKSYGFGGTCYFKKNKKIPYVIRLQSGASAEFTIFHVND